MSMKEDARQQGLFVVRKDLPRDDKFIDRLVQLFRSKKSETEERKLKLIRPILQPEKDLESILAWFSDPETVRHLDTFPDLPKDWEDDEQIKKAMFKLHEYYLNFGDDPKKITALVAVDEKDGILGVETIRWRGDPFIPRGSKIKIAGIERLITDPLMRRKGIGSSLVNEALRTAFEERNYDEVRAWIFSDDQAGDWSANFEFLRNLGFSIYGGPNKTWREYAKARGMGENEQNRDAIWLSIKRKVWEAAKSVPQSELKDQPVVE